MEDSTRYAPLPGADREEPLYDRTFIVRDCTEAQLTALALHMEDAGIDYDKVETEDIPMCKTIARETVKALEYIISELEKIHLFDHSTYCWIIHREPTIQPHSCVVRHSRHGGNRHLFL